MNRLVAFLAALSLVVAPAALAKKGPHRIVDPTATASYANGVVSVAACGYDFDGLNNGSADFATITWTLPDGSSVTYLVGMWLNGCIDTNSLPVTESGTYTVSVSQLTQNGGVLLEGTDSITVP